MNKNITMSMNIELLKKAKKIAIEKNTTVSSLIRNYLQQLVEREELHRNQAAAELESLFNAAGAHVGIKNWSREDLYER